MTGGLKAISAIAATLAWIHSSHASTLDFAVGGYLEAEAEVYGSSAYDLGSRSEEQGVHVHPFINIQLDVDTALGASDSVVVEGWTRLDAEQTTVDIADIRQANWRHYGARFETRVGVLREVWGVLESGSLVDIINQKDAREDYKLQTRLGQLGAGLKLPSSWGDLDVILTSLSRQRRFPEQDRHFSIAPYEIVYEAAEFESSAEEKRIDVAMRNKVFIDNGEVAFSYFYGNSREPRFNLAQPTGGDVFLMPYYDVIEQVGLETLWIAGGAILKMEAINRETSGESFSSVAVGVEREFSRIRGSKSSLSLFAEAVYDGRSRSSPTVIFDRDVFIGARWALNDFADTAVELQFLYDYRSQSQIRRVTFRRRLGSEWLLSAETDYFVNVGRDLAIANFQDDNRFQLQLRYLY